MIVTLCRKPTLFIEGTVHANISNVHIIEVDFA
jgi:hypothetical protein